MKTLLNSGLRSDAPDESSFVTLRSGQSHSIDVDLHLAIYDGMKSTEHFLRPGAHILCIAVWTWYYPPSSAKAFRTRWRSKGVLWSDTVESMPMVFSVESSLSLVFVPSIFKLVYNEPRSTTVRLRANVDGLLSMMRS